MKNQSTKLLCTAFTFVLLLGIDAAAQSQYSWLEAKPLPSWSERSRAILQTKKIAQAELTRCRSSLRPATLPVDSLLTKYNWTLVGDAQVFGKTTAVTVATSFDGMCRPLGFQTYVFVGNRVAGTVSPGPMDSRTDASLINIRLLSETDVIAEYARYKENDPLCCPSKTNTVSFNIKRDGQNWLMKPDFVSEAAYNMSEAKENSDTANLTGTVWHWESLQTPTEKISVPVPKKYTLEFMTDGKAQILADCNRGRGSYQLDGQSLTFSGFITTKMGCPPGSLDGRFLRSLDAARTLNVKGDELYIDLTANSGTMKFVKAKR
ncbi:MAG: META domain-containing protein [Acidobacteria bacterium]|jgi:heat shock protein HslJ|nr:META domain-containing protein [Acidobacteriota bacterium]